MPSNGNFAIFNTLIRPVGSTTRTTSNGNTTVSSSSGSWGIVTTLAANTGKWYCEFYVNAGSSGRNVGIVPTNSQKYNDGDYTQGGSGDYAITLNSGGSLYNNGSVTQTVASNMATGDIMSVAMNLDASPKTVQFYKNGSTIGSAENINSSATGPYAFQTLGHNQSTVTINAGQDSSFAGAKTSGSANAADDNGFGDFYYTPPSGFLALCSANLPISDDIDPAQTDSDFPQKQFNTVLYSGNGGTNNITGVGFQPDLVWIKSDSTTYDHRWWDSSRGVQKYLESNTTDVEGTLATGLTSFDSDGFTLGSAGSQNNSSNTYVAWCWRANGGTTSTNNDGSTTSTVQANTKAGFSIITYTGNASNRTIGHGLSSAPEFMIIKERDGTNNWIVYSKSQGAAKRANLNNNIAWGSSSTSFQSTDPDNSVITLGTSNGTNANGSEYVCYAWHSVEGYSKFGTYEANSNADGPFIYTGFRPAFIFFKGVVSGAAWVIKDDTLDGSNPGSGVLQPSSNAAKYTSAGGVCDIVSNGFKVRTTNAVANSQSYDPYVYAAWGSVPFKYNNTF